MADVSSVIKAATKELQQALPLQLAAKQFSGKRREIVVMLMPASPCAEKQARASAQGRAAGLPCGLAAVVDYFPGASFAEPMSLSVTKATATVTAVPMSVNQGQKME